MSIKFGGTYPSSIKLGETEVSKMYMGEALVYEKVTTKNINKDKFDKKGKAV